MSKIKLLERYITKATRLPLPFGKGRYVVDVVGKLYDAKEKRFIVGEHDNLYKIVINGVERYVSMDWLLAATFKPMWNSEKFLFDWTVIRSGGNAISNLYWKPPVGGQDCDIMPGFKIVPHMGKLSVSSDGKTIFNREKHIKMGIRKSPNGYLNFNCVTVDGHKNTVGVHRAVALAWIEYDERIAFLIANHLYGNKENNNKDDLEWATYAENNVHAKDTGLNLSRSSVSVKDYLTGEISTYASMCDAARPFNIGSGSVHGYLTKHRDGLKFGRYLFRFNDGIDTFPELTDNYVREFHQSYLDLNEGRRCAARCIVTGTIYIYDSAAALMRGIGIDKVYKANVYAAIGSLKDTPIFGYVLSRASNIKPMRAYTDDEIELYKTNVSVNGGMVKAIVDREKREKVMPMSVYDHYTGTETRLASTQAVANHLKTSREDVLHWIGLKAKYPFAYRWSIRAAYLDKPWPTFTVEELILLKQKTGQEKERLKCKATNMLTGETHYAEYPAQLGKMIGIEPSNLTKALNSTLNYPYLNYFLSYQNKPKPVPTLKEDEIIGLRDKTGIINPIRATFPDGSTKVFADAYECSDCVGIHPSHVAHMALSRLTHRSTKISFEKVLLS